MDYLDFEDRLEPVGIAVGALLVLVGVATVLGMPWGVKPVGPALVQVLGALATAAIGAGLVYISRVEN
jgi:hypothetical protein